MIDRETEIDQKYRLRTQGGISRSWGNTGKSPQEPSKGHKVTGARWHVVGRCKMETGGAGDESKEKRQATSGLCRVS